MALRAATSVVAAPLLLVCRLRLLLAAADQPPGPENTMELKDEWCLAMVIHEA